jgi:mannose-1-phosphate guanylyltransferase/phosphomannomutase
VRPGVKIWPDKNIEAGATVTMSLIWGHTWQGSLFGELGVSGIANREISPEFATRLGSAFGCFLKPGTTVLTARDSGRAARMVKRAVIAGLMSVGCNVEDLRSASLPIMRHSLRESAASGGVYVRLSPDDPRILLVELLDGDGVYLSTSAERKVESIFFREDWRRADAADIGKLDFSGHSVEQYQEAYLRNLAVRPVYDRHWKVVVDFSFSRVASVFGGVLGHLGCDVVALNAFGDPARTPEKHTDRDRLLADLSRTVRTLGADLGAMIEHDGERLAVVDERGRAVEGDRLLMLFAVLVARTGDGPCVAVPASATSRLEGMLALHNASVRRTKRDVRSLLAAAAETGDGQCPVAMAGDRSGGFSFPRFHNAFDAMFATGKLLEALTATGLTPAEVVDGLPDVHVLHSQMRCPWQAKGRVMLEVSNMAAEAAMADLTDGAKLIDGDAWTLVIPDASAPVVHVIAEDKTREAAQERLDHMVAALEPLIGDATPVPPGRVANSETLDRAN